MTSIILDEVNDGAWGANGAIWHLPDFIQAAGYRHLQDLAQPQTLQAPAVRPAPLYNGARQFIVTA
ncbi:hypothetical protein [Pseudomonas sp. GM33]|jgi:hypothetical protein|uniref:hypothetical protein n=1 Tax=Pseudomonas sp. GM33 TaxID=1144329 RepID=UPI00031CCC60|nr:hypothetical protein [Pseudomonas sp. GM33]